MAKEVLLYGAIYDSSVEDFINQMEAYKNYDVRLRLNSPGGSVLSGYGAIAKWKEHAKNKTVHVDGQAKSMGFMFVAAANRSTCLNVSEFMAHRAAYPSWVENDKELFTEDMKKSLIKTNGELRNILEAKVSEDKWVKETGISYNTLFSIEGRVDVPLNAQQACRMGLVDEVIDLTAEKKAEIEELASTYHVAAFANTPTIIQTEIPMEKIITAADFKIANPQAYAEIVKEGKQLEKDRVAGWQAWKDVDTEAVAKGIEDGTEVTAKVISEMSAKAVSKTALDKMKADNTEKIATPATPPKELTAEQKEAAAFLADCEKEMGITAK